MREVGGSSRKIQEGEAGGNRMEKQDGEEKVEKKE